MAVAWQIYVCAGFSLLGPTRKETLCLSAFLSSQIDRGYSRAHSSKQQTDRAVGRGGSLAEQAKGRLSSPVMTTSRRPSPWMKLAYRGPGSSLPRPYDGSGSTSGHLLVSCARGSPCTHTMHSISTHPVYYSKHALHCTRCHCPFRSIHQLQLVASRVRVPVYATQYAPAWP